MSIATDVLCTKLLYTIYMRIFTCEFFRLHNDKNNTIGIRLSKFQIYCFIFFDISSEKKLQSNNGDLLILLRWTNSNNIFFLWISNKGILYVKICKSYRILNTNNFSKIPKIYIPDIIMPYTL